MSLGCAVYRPTLKTETTGVDGSVTVQSISIPTFVVWPATSEIAKQKASVGKTLSLGVDGLKEDGGGTNMVGALRGLRDLVQALKVP